MVIGVPLHLSGAGLRGIEELFSNPKVSLYGKNKQLFKSGKVSENAKHKIVKSDKMVQQFDAMEMAMNAYLNH